MLTWLFFLLILLPKTLPMTVSSPSDPPTSSWVSQCTLTVSMFPIMLCEIGPVSCWSCGDCPVSVGRSPPSPART